jgi:hypothetical protein
MFGGSEDNHGKPNSHDSRYPCRVLNRTPPSAHRTLACRFVSRQRLGTQVPAATNTRATVELLLETVLSVVRAAAVATKRHRKHVSATANSDATIEVLLETVISIRSVQRGYKENSWSENSSVGKEPSFREDLRTEAEESPLLEAITRKRLVKTLQAGKDLESVEISDSVIVICSWACKWSVNPIIQNLVYSHAYYVTVLMEMNLITISDALEHKDVPLAILQCC